MSTTQNAENVVLRRGDPIGTKVAAKTLHPKAGGSLYRQKSRLVEASKAPALVELVLQCLAHLDTIFVITDKWKPSLRLNRGDGNTS